MGSSASLFSPASNERGGTENQAGGSTERSGSEPGPHAPMTGSAPSGSDSTDTRDTASTQRTSWCDYSRCGSEKTPNSAAGTVRLEKKRFVQFVASERFVKKLEKAKALLSNGRGDLSYEAVLEAALDEFLKDHDPEERNKRRENASRSGGEPRSVDGREVSSAPSGLWAVDGPASERRAVDPPTTRFFAREAHRAAFPAAVRDAVLRPRQRPLHVHRLERQALRRHASLADRSCHPVRERRHERAPIISSLLCERHNKIGGGAGPGSKRASECPSKTIGKREHTGRSEAPHLQCPWGGTNANWAQKRTQSEQRA